MGGYILLIGSVGLLVVIVARMLLSPIDRQPSWKILVVGLGVAWGGIIAGIILTSEW